MDGISGLRLDTMFDEVKEVHQPYGSARVIDRQRAMVGCIALSGRVMLLINVFVHSGLPEVEQ